MDEAEMLSRVNELWLDVNYPRTEDLWGFLRSSTKFVTQFIHTG
jgi:hypothetical protein